MNILMNQRKTLGTLAMVFVGVFIYAIVAMVVSRELVIPRMVPSINGNIAGDPQYYHSLALKKVEEIKALGIKEFELRPEGQGPAGIASLLYLIWENPYSVVLVNAILHALSVVMMTMILMQWFSLRTSIIGTLPLAISPNMIVWFSQINKDTFALVGALLFTYGLLRLVSVKEKSLLSYGGLLSLLITVTGILLTWIVRPYVNQILLPITGLILVITLSLRARRGIDGGKWTSLAVYGAFILACLGLLGHGAASDATLEGFNNSDSQGPVEGPVKAQAVVAKCFASIEEKNWRNQRFFPDFVNKSLKSMMGQRCLMFTLLETQTNATTKYSFVDTNKFPGGSEEALAYLPHAALLGVFSPWPDRWGYAFYKKPSVFYTVTPIEAILLYIGFASLVVWLVLNKAWSVSIPIALCTTVMTIYGMATPFIGALYRYRYPWWILLICFGIAAFLTLMGKLRSNLRA